MRDSLSAALFGALLALIGLNALLFAVKAVNPLIASDAWHVVDKNGQERNFGQGGPIGLKETGPWLRPGITFKIRAADSKQELGSVVIGEKQC
jgi:hypothetical protein